MLNFIYSRNCTCCFRNWRINTGNSFVKNLFGKVIADGEFLKSAGGLIVGVAAAGVIPSFTQAVSADTAMLTAGGAWATTKIAATYKEYQEKRNITERYVFLLQGRKIAKIDILILHRPWREVMKLYWLPQKSK